uniref:Uncharacterized protein n=1 Tax=Rhizophora mucronata TaxID=61149 RepID=A0A2P2PSM6_RHIMU
MSSEIKQEQRGEAAACGGE